MDFTVISEPIDTQRSFYTHDWRHASKSLQVLRLYLTKPRHRDGSVSVSPPPAITYKTFYPVQLTKPGRFIPARYESQHDTSKRIMAWLSLTGNYWLKT